MAFRATWKKETETFSFFLQIHSLEVIYAIPELLIVHLDCISSIYLSIFIINIFIIYLSSTIYRVKNKLLKL